MRALLATGVTSSLLLLSACGTLPQVTDNACYAIAATSRVGQSLQLAGDLTIDQHGDFLRPSGCTGPAIRVYGIPTADGLAAAQLRKEIAATQTLYEVHWVVDTLVRVERDEGGLILRVLSVSSAKRE